MTNENEKNDGRRGRTWTQNQKEERSRDYLARREDFVEAGREGGRPSYDEEDKLQRTVGTTLSTREKKAVSQTASEEGDSQSSFIRTAILEEILAASEDQKALWRSAPQKEGQKSYPAAEEPRIKQVNALLREGEDEQLGQIADDVNLSKSSLIRLAILSRVSLPG